MSDTPTKRRRLNAYRNVKALAKEDKTMRSLREELGIERQNFNNWRTRGIPCCIWPDVAKYYGVSVWVLISNVMPDKDIHSVKPPGCIECDICRKRKFDKEKPLSFQDLICLAIRVYLFLTKKKCAYYIDNECTYNFEKQD